MSERLKGALKVFAVILGAMLLCGVIIVGGVALGVSFVGPAGGVLGGAVSFCVCVALLLGGATYFG